MQKEFDTKEKLVKHFEKKSNFEPNIKEVNDDMIKCLEDLEKVAENVYDTDLLHKTKQFAKDTIKKYKTL